MKIVGAIIGAVLAFGWGDYHNQHVSIWTGGFMFSGTGLLLLAVAGAVVGMILGSLIGRTFHA